MRGDNPDYLKSLALSLMFRRGKKENMIYSHMFFKVWRGNWTVGKDDSEGFLQFWSSTMNYNYLDEPEPSWTYSNMFLTYLRLRYWCPCKWECCSLKKKWTRKFVLHSGSLLPRPLWQEVRNICNFNYIQSWQIHKHGVWVISIL